MKKKSLEGLVSKLVKKVRFRIDPELDKVDRSGWFKEKMNIGEAILKKSSVPPLSEKSMAGLPERK